jgi:hypothetical protein
MIHARSLRRLAGNVEHRFTRLACTAARRRRGGRPAGGDADAATDAADRPPSHRASSAHGHQLVCAAPLLPSIEPPPVRYSKQTPASSIVRFQPFVSSAGGVRLIPVIDLLAAGRAWG